MGGEGLHFPLHLLGFGAAEPARRGHRKEAGSPVLTAGLETSLGAGGQVELSI